MARLKELRILVDDNVNVIRLTLLNTCFHSHSFGEVNRYRRAQFKL